MHFGNKSNRLGINIDYYIIFEPAFNKVIDRFQETFDTCTSSFGEAFRQDVTVVAND